MNPHFQRIIDTVEPLPDPIYGPRYRCALTLKDGTKLPCVILQSKAKLLELAKRRIKEEMNGKGKLISPDPYGDIVETFVTSGNTISEFVVADAAPSPFAPPLSLLEQIDGETVMAWTAWVFEMSDGRLFPYGSDFSLEFMHLPYGYRFENVVKVHSHSFLSPTGELRSIEQFGRLPDDYNEENILRDRIYFTCFIDGI